MFPCSLELKTKISVYLVSYTYDLKIFKYLDILYYVYLVFTITILLYTHDSDHLFFTIIDL